MTSVQPVLIAEVVVTALSLDAYNIASSPGSPIEAWLSDQPLILRQGDVHTFGANLRPTNGHGISWSRKTYQFRLDMIEPVLQGYARKGSTRFYVTLADTESLSFDEFEFQSGDESGSDPDGIEIDECFLASSVLHARQNPSHPMPPKTVSKSLQYANAVLNEPTMPHIDSSFRIEPLQEPTFTLQDDCTLYIRTSDLGRVGVLNGDWVRFLLQLC